jgi:uncharacterized protein
MHYDCSTLFAITEANCIRYFALFFPVDIAIALTGVVHFANNIFKMGLVGKMASKPVLIRFGIPAILASFAGAWVLLRIIGLPSFYEYEFFGKYIRNNPCKTYHRCFAAVFLPTGGFAGSTEN